jgi:hypothetical protein
MDVQSGVPHQTVVIDSLRITPEIQALIAEIDEFTVTERRG